MDIMTNALTGKDISLSFGGIKVLKGLNVTFRAGEITGLIGPNGAGKTSLFNCLTGAYTPQEGEIAYGGESLNGLPPAARATKGIVRSFQHVALCPDLTVRENVMMGIARNGTAGWLSAFVPLPKGGRERAEMANAADAALADLGLPDTVETWISARLQAVGWGSSSIHYLSLGGLSEILLWSPCDDFDAGVIPNQDSFIQTLARIENIPVLGLEPPDRLIRHLNHPDNHALARAMVAVYGSYLAPMENSDGFAAHITLYIQGKIATSMVMDQEWTLNALGNEGPALYERLNNYLLDQRNHDFITAAEAALQEGGLFMGVGAYHLPGHQGVVELLRTKGYQVDRVPLPDETTE